MNEAFYSKLYMIMNLNIQCTKQEPGRVAKSVRHLSRKSGVLGSIPGLATYFRSPSADSRRAVVSYWRKYVHEVLVNRLGGLSLPRKSVVRLTDRPDMTLDVYRGRKTTIQQQQLNRTGRERTDLGERSCNMHAVLRNDEPFLSQLSVLGYHANSADPAQTPPNAASDLGLHCLLTEIFMDNIVKMKISTRNPLN